MLICLQCTMKALVDNEPIPRFSESVEEHMARVHPDPVDTQLQREYLEAVLKQRLQDRPFYDPNLDKFFGKG